MCVAIFFENFCILIKNLMKVTFPGFIMLQILEVIEDFFGIGFFSKIVLNFYALIISRSRSRDQFPPTLCFQIALFVSTKCKEFN